MQWPPLYKADMGLTDRGSQLATAGPSAGSALEAPLRSNRWADLATAALITLGLARLACGLLLGFRPFDDSFITFRYARNLAHGYGLVFNLGEPVLGTSAPLWALILGTANWLGFDIPQAAFLLSLVLDVLTALMLSELVRRLAENSTLGIMAGLLLLGTADFLSISRSGMETSLFCCLVAGSMAAAERGWTRVALFLAGLTCLARLEGVLVLVAVSAVCFCYPTGLDRRKAIRALAIPFVLIVVSIILALAYYGSPVPTSVVAKASHVEHDHSLRSFSWMNLRLFAYLGQYGGAVFERTWLELRVLWSALAMMGAAAITRDYFRRQAPRTLAALILLVILPIAYVGTLAVAGAFTWYPWYYGPLHFFLAPLAAVGASVIAGLPVRWGARIQRCSAALIVAVLLLAQLVAALAIKFPSDREFWVRGYQQALAGWMPPAGETVAALEVGTIGWELWPARILDLEGLISPEAIGRDRVDVLLAARARYLCIRSDNGAALLAALHSDPQRGKPFHPIRTVQDPFGNRKFLLLESSGRP